MAVVPISQEDPSVASFRQVEGKLPADPPFRVLGDINRRSAPRLARTTAYLLDEDGFVRQVFPMSTYARANWWAILNEIDRLTP